MSAPNKHGLSRDIPEAIQRAVRQRSGFGCVVCGSAIYQYEHVDPPFVEAPEHNAEAITLLCGACHDRVTRRLLSKESVLAAMQKPRSLQAGFSFGPFDVGNEHPDVFLGPFRAIRTHTIIRVFGDPILAVDPPEAQGAPFRLSAMLCDHQEREILRIVENEWQAPTTNWDVEVVGPRITIRRGSRDIALILRTDPPKSLVVERLDMTYRGTRIECDEKRGLIVRSPGGAAFQAYAATATECVAGIDVHANGLGVGHGCKSLWLGHAVMNPR